MCVFRHSSPILNLIALASDLSYAELFYLLGYTFDSLMLLNIFLGLFLS